MVENCVKCGKPMAERGIFWRVSRSKEWHISELIQIEEEGNKTIQTRLHRGEFCEVCLNQIESIIYNWWHGLSLNHAPFQP